MRQRPTSRRNEPLTLAILAGALAALASVAPALTDAPPLALEVRLTASTFGVLQVFYDRGHGFTASDSASAVYGGSDAPQTLRLPLPEGRYQSFRIDPSARPGRFVVHAIGFVDGGNHRLAAVPLQQMRPLTAMTITLQSDGAAALDVGAGEFDPQLLYQPPNAVVLRRPPPDALGATLAFVAVFVLVLLAAAAIAAIDRRNTVVSRLRTAARASPSRVVLTLAVLGTVAAMHPVLRGRSLVSPAVGPAVLLYDVPPYSPAGSITDAENARGADVGATMWAILPYTAIQRRALAEGEFPLWNRFNSAGVPLWGQGQTFILDPFHLASLAIPDLALAMDARFVVGRAIFAAGVGLAVLAATGSWRAAALLAFVAPFVGHFTMRFNHPAYFSIVYVPWILWAYVRRLSTPALRTGVWIVWLAGTTYLQLVGSTPKEGLVALLAAHATGVIGLALARQPRGVRTEQLLAAAAAGVIAVLLTAPHWLIFLDTWRGAGTLYDRPAAEFAGLPQFVGFALGSVVPGTLMTGVHALVCLSAAVAAAHWRRLIASGPALGAATASAALIAVASGLVPSSVILRVPLVANVHHLADVTFAAAVAPMLLLAGYGVAYALDGASRRSTAIPLFLTALVLMVLAAANASGGAQLLAILLIGAAAAVFWSATRRGSPSTPGALALLVAAYLAVAPGGLHDATGVAAADALLIAPQPRVDLAATSAAVRAVQHGTASEPGRATGIGWVLFPGTQSVWGLEAIGGPDALRLPAIDALSDAAGVARSEWRWRAELQPERVAAVSPFLDMLNVRYLVAREDQVPPAVSAVAVSGPDLLRVTEQPSAWPRAFFVDGVERHASVAALLQRLRQRSGPFASVAANESSAVGDLPGVASRFAAATGYVFTSNSTTFTVEAPTRGVAVLSESFVADDFVVSLNDEPVDYIRVNHAFKGVVLPRAGTWRVTFRYRPRLWTAAWLMCGLGVFALTCAVVAAPLLGRRRHQF